MEGVICRYVNWGVNQVIAISSKIHRVLSYYCTVSYKNSSGKRSERQGFASYPIKIHDTRIYSPEIKSWECAGIADFEYYCTFVILFILKQNPRQELIERLLRWTEHFLRIFRIACVLSRKAQNKITLPTLYFVQAWFIFRPNSPSIRICESAISSETGYAVSFILIVSFWELACLTKAGR